MKHGNGDAKDFLHPDFLVGNLKKDIVRFKNYTIFNNICILLLKGRSNNEGNLNLQRKKKVSKTNRVRNMILENSYCLLHLI